MDLGQFTRFHLPQKKLSNIPWTARIFSGTGVNLTNTSVPFTFPGEPGNLILGMCISMLEFTKIPSEINELLCRLSRMVSSTFLLGLVVHIRK